MAHFFAFFTLFHLSLTFFRPEFPFKMACANLQKNLLGCAYFKESYNFLKSKLKILLYIHSNIHSFNVTCIIRCDLYDSILLYYYVKSKR